MTLLPTSNWCGNIGHEVASTLARPCKSFRAQFNENPTDSCTHYTRISLRRSGTGNGVETRWKLRHSNDLYVEKYFPSSAKRINFSLPNWASRLAYIVCGKNVMVVIVDHMRTGQSPTPWPLPTYDIQGALDGTSFPLHKG